MIRGAISLFDPSALLAWEVPTAVGIFALAGTLVIGVLVGVLLRWGARRRNVDEVRELVRSLEELRSGSMSRRPSVERNSQLALVSDAIGRLGEDVSARWKDVDGASDRLQAVLGAVPDLAILTIDDDGDVTSLGSGGASLLGYDEPQLVGYPLSKLFDEEAWREFLPKLSRKVLRVRGTETRACLRRADGTSIVTRIALRGLLDARGRLQGFLLVLREDTTREEMEQALHSSEARYRQLLEGLREGVMILEQGVVIYANPAASEQLQVPLDTFVDKPWRERVALEDVLLVRQALEGLPARDGDSHVLSLRLRESAPMRRIRLESAAVPYNGHRCWLCTFQVESTSRAPNRTVVEEQDVRREELWDTTDAAILLQGTADALRVREVGGETDAWFGAKPERGMLWSEFLTSLQDAESSGRLVQWWSQDPRVDGRFVFTRGGKRTVLAVRWIPIGEAGEGWIRIRDVSDAVEGEQRLETATQQVEKLEAWGEELQRLEKMKTRLLRNVSHELQTPLVSIRGFSEMILKERLGPLNEEQKKGLSISLKGIDRLISMIDGLSAFTHDGEASAAMKLSVFPLAEVIGEIVTLQEPERERDDLSLRTEIVDPLALVEADRDRTAQVFTNLLSNAMKYNRPGGAILVRTRPVDDFGLPVEIHDTGIGIAADKLDKVFEPGGRAREEDKSRGSGLGLSIVRDLLRMHGCEIRLQSEVGKGSCFSFHLPVPVDTKLRSRSAGELEPVVEPAVEPSVESAVEPVNGDSLIEELLDEAQEAPQRKPARLLEDEPRFRILRND